MHFSKSTRATQSFPCLHVCNPCAVRSASLFKDIRCRYNPAVRNSPFPSKSSCSGQPSFRPASQHQSLRREKTPCHIPAVWGQHRLNPSRQPESHWHMGCRDPRFDDPLWGRGCGCGIPLWGRGFGCGVSLWKRGQRSHSYSCGRVWRWHRLWFRLWKCESCSRELSRGRIWGRKRLWRWICSFQQRREDCQQRQHNSR